MTLNIENSPEAAQAIVRRILDSINEKAKRRAVLHEQLRSCASSIWRLSAEIAQQRALLGLEQEDAKDREPRLPLSLQAEAVRSAAPDARPGERKRKVYSNGHPMRGDVAVQRHLRVLIAALRGGRRLTVNELHSFSLEKLDERDRPSNPGVTTAMLSSRPHLFRRVERGVYELEEGAKQPDPEDQRDAALDRGGAP